MVREDPEQRSRIMRAVKSRDTGPEMLVRRLVFAMGYRYRLHAKHLPGKPDLVFASRAKIVFVHGCFWHGHHCARGNRLPKNNAEYWRLKIGRNFVRDSIHVSQLEAAGWDVLIIWECETKDHDNLTRRLLAFLE